jgi:hypothetical protein
LNPAGYLQAPPIQIHLVVRQPHGLKFFQWNHFQVAGVQRGGIFINQTGHWRVFGQDNPFRPGPDVFDNRQERTAEKTDTGKEMNGFSDKISAIDREYFLLIFWFHSLSNI